ncbi:metallophosphoesterase [Colwellia sp. MB02u-10]|uniref:metallophosphoesterase family protein n=1 Tax=Colwellia sp. MB02u-10 TaxID=2759828 RepID=UPI0015F4A3F4|nr:metallophosphoesterase [Colwellia sp. MB02u-10]MBA6343024.1 metallophosphoesterase [Colwellia sp. MB02u-10]
MTDIIHLSDLHFGQDKFPFEIKKLYAGMCEFLRQFENPIVLVTGDITFQNRDEGYAEAGDFFKQLISDGLIKKERFLCCPGNHDIEASIEPFKKYDSFIYGIRRDNALCFSKRNTIIHELDGVEFILLNSSFHANHQYGYIDEECFQHIEDKTYSEKFKLVAVHHNLLGQQKEDTSTIRNAYPTLYHLDLAKINLILHGHQHCHQEMFFGSSQFTIHSARSFGFIEDSLQNGINHIKINDNVAKITPYYFSLDAKPSKITLIKN